MGFRAAFTAAANAVSRPYLVLPVAFVAVITLLSPPAIDDASAQGLRMQGPRGGFSNNMGSGRLTSAGPGLASKSAVLQGGRAGPRLPGANTVTGAGNTNAGKGGMGGGGMRGGGMGGRNPGVTADGGGMGGGMGGGGMRGGMGGDRPPGRPGFPIPPIVTPGGDTVVTVPGGSTSGPPANVSGGGGGGQPSSTPPAQSNQQPTNWGRYVPNEVVVEVASTVTPESINALLRRHRLTQLETVNLQSSGTSIRRLRINDRRGVPAVVRALAAEGFTVQPNLIATLQEAALATSQAALEQYAIARMRMPEAHTLATGQRVLIAVIDSGADAQHPELAGMIVDTFDAIGSGDRTHAHGTSIVGAIAARSRLQGTAPGAHILMARAFGTQRGSMDGTSTDIIKALEWAMSRGARVINMSFAGSRDPGIERRIAAARQRGIILVAAAGNAGPTSAPLYPAANPAVIAVTATDIDDRIYRMANRGNHVAIAAPGVDLWLPTVDGGYRRTSGTSFSAAEITGVIALMLERSPDLTAEAVRRALLSTARDLGTPGLDPLFGAGLVDAYQAVSSVLPPTLEANEAPATAGIGPGTSDN